MKDFDAEDPTQPSGGGATGIFGEVPNKAAANEAGTNNAAPYVPLMSTPSAPPAPLAPPANPAPNVAPSVAAGGGFTQLLRTLSLYEPMTSKAAAQPVGVLEQVRPSSTEAPIQGAPSPQPAAAPVSSLGSFTEMFETVRAEVTSAAVPVAQGQMPPAVPAGVAAAPVPAAAGPSGGFTQLFQVLDSEPKARAPEVPAQPAVQAQPVQAQPVQAQSWAPVQPAAQPMGGPAPSATAAPRTGGFTQLFRSLESKAQVAEAPLRPVVTVPAVAAPVAVTPPRGDGFTQLVQAFGPDTVAPVPPVTTGTPAVAAGPAPSSTPAPAPTPTATTAPAYPGGAITQLLRAIDLSGLRPAEPATAAVPPSSTAPAAAVSPMPATPAPVSAPVAAPAPVASSQAVGSFTQMFNVMDHEVPQRFAAPAPVVSTPPAAPVPPMPPSPPPASFTQIFSSVGSQPGREPSQADSFPPLATGAASRPEYATAKPPAGYGQEAPRAWDEPRFSSPTPPRPSFPSGSYSEPQPRVPEPSPSSSGGMGGGGLTQLLRTLDGPSPAAPVPPKVESSYTPPAGSSQSGATTAFRLPTAGAPTSPVAASAPAGPGEFTRIIQASAFRESALQGGSRAAGAAMPSPGAAAPAAAPAGFPPLPTALPPMPAMPHGGGGGFVMPPMPAAPAVPALTLPPMPAAPAPAPAPASQYLPILLIIIIVLLVAVLLAVVLLMKK